jgi:hypothetical protein
MASSTTRAFATTPRHSSADTDRTSSWLPSRERTHSHTRTAILGLSSILVDELLYEVEGKRTTREPAFLMAFREEGVWTVSTLVSSFFAPGLVDVDGRVIDRGRQGQRQSHPRPQVWQRNVGTGSRRLGGTHMVTSNRQHPCHVLGLRHRARERRIRG